MPVTITPVYSLHGTVSIPGDTRLTASLMAFAACSGSSLVIENAPDDPAIENFAKVLSGWGCIITKDAGILTVTGTALPSDITITEDIPSSVVHMIAAGAAASGSRIVFPRGTIDDRLFDTITGSFFEDSGLSCTKETRDDAVIISDALFSCENRLTINSTRQMEALVTCVVATGKDISVISTSDKMSWPMKIASVFGVGMNDVDDPAHAHDFEITRRLARANGEQPPELIHLSRTGLPVERVRIPGDTRFAAAMAGLTSCLQRSDVKVTDVLWEPGRRGFFDSIRRMKGSVTVSARTGHDHFDSADVTVTWKTLENIDVSPRQASYMPDELLTLAAVATSASGETVINDTDDGWGIGRTACRMCARGFETLGVDVGDYADGIVLRGRRDLSGGNLETGGDENVALALSLAAMTASGTVTLTDVNNNEYLIKSFLRIVSECTGI